MRKHEPYGKDVFSACGILVNGPTKAVNKANQEKTIDMAEDVYSSMSIICRPARLIYERYGVPFPLVVAAIWEGMEHNYVKGASFARGVTATGNTLPLGWPTTLAKWLQAHKPAEGCKWNRDTAYNAIRNACQGDLYKWHEMHLDEDGDVVVNVAAVEKPKAQELEQPGVEAHVKSCINRCAGLMTELYDILHGISGAVPETAAGKSCVSRQRKEA